MKTRQMSMLRVLSVMVLLLFAAPMMDGVLTLSQSQHFGETTIFETSVYAHPANPSEGDKHDHKDEKWTDACKKALCSGALLLGTISYTAEAVQNDAPGGGGSETVQFRETGRSGVIIDPCCCSDNDNDNDSTNANANANANDNDNDSDSDSDSD